LIGSKPDREKTYREWLIGQLAVGNTPSTEFCEDYVERIINFADAIIRKMGEETEKK
jgi:hypothetical protein